MAKINTADWKEFLIGELFEIINGKGITRAELIEHPGKIAAIQSGEEQNGCMGFIDEQYCRDKGYYIQYEPALTVARSGSSGHITYQEQPFVVGDSAKILKSKYKMNVRQFLFMRTILMENKKRYSYNDKVSEKRYRKDKIKLPADRNGNPDWKGMDEYIKGIEKLSRAKLKEFQLLVSEEDKMIDITLFKRFHLYDEGLFVINSGTKLDKIRMTNNNPEINFVGRANANNGVTDFIDRIKGLKPYAAGNMTISLGGEYLGSCFVQDKPFYTSQNVNVLIPQWDMPYYCKQYIASMVFREGRLHYKAFIDELNRHMKKDFTIPLPVDSNENIDWDYMEEYMKKIEQTVKEKLQAL